MKKLETVATEKASIRDSWTEREREKRRQIADVKLLQLIQILESSMPADQQQICQEVDSQVATAC